MWSSVEKSFLQRSGRQERYEGEKIPVIEVGNIYELGKIVALRFIEWIASHPEGVVALPTGKTPEYFIKTLERYRLNWNHTDVIQERVGYGLDPSISAFPDTRRLHFVMLDEFFPMLPTHRNSFCNYVRTFYTGPLGIKNENILDFDLISHQVITEEDMNQFDKVVDLSLLTRDANNELETTQKAILLKVQAYCDEYEKKIQAFGGIGFFLGGIGPDGHIAFNQEGCDHNSLTRLVPFNYPSAAAAAGDLGGIEIARGKAAATIGLGTITWKKDATIIIMAAGEGKAAVVRDAIENEPAPARPASVLQGLPGARFYITHGAAMKLTMRKQEKVQQVDDTCLQWALNHLSGNVRSTSPYMIQPPADYLLLESGIYDVSLKTKIPVHKLRLQEIQNRGHQIIELPKWMLDNELAFQIICSCASRRLKEKINGGIIESSPVGKKILHTAPHHDDIMLSYHCAMHEMLGRQPVIGFDNFSHSLQQRSRGNTFNGFPSLLELATAGGRGSFTGVPSPRRGGIDGSSHGGSGGGRPGHVRQHSGNSNTFSAYQSQMLGERHNQNLNHFAYLTSGFHSVNEQFLHQKVDACLSIVGRAGQLFVEDAVHTGQLTREYDDLMCLFSEAFFDKQSHLEDYIENIIFLRKIAEVWKIEIRETYSKLINNLKEKLLWMKNEYLPHHQPGDAIPREIQLLKGCMRESEVDRVWALSSMPNNRIHHMRSKFYTDDFFTPMPSLEDDALPMANLIRSRQPDVLTVAFDPEGTGPDTHYKVLQVVAAGLRVALSREDLDNPDVLVWGYRNVWFVFPPSQATLMIPCSEEDLNLMHDTFMSCFTTQKNASFPSPFYDGPFSAWARQIQYEQRQMLETLLGEEYFLNHANPKVRNSKGFIFIQAMHANTFLAEVQELKSKFENVITSH